MTTIMQQSESCNSCHTLRCWCTNGFQVIPCRSWRAPGAAGILRAGQCKRKSLPSDSLKPTHCGYCCGRIMQLMRLGPEFPGSLHVPESPMSVFEEDACGPVDPTYLQDAGSRGLIGNTLSNNSRTPVHNHAAHILGNRLLSRRPGLISTIAKYLKPSSVGLHQ